MRPNRSAAPRRLRRLRAALPLLALLPAALAAAPAQAAVFCASTGAQLDSALLTAAGNGVDDEIRVVSGTLTGSSQSNGSTRWLYKPGASDLDTSLTLSGGWSAGNNCATQSTNDPEATILDAQYVGPVLGVQVIGSDALLGDVVIRNLTLTRGFANNAGEISGFDWNVNGTITSSLLLENMLVVAGSANAANTAAVNIAANASGSAKVRNLIVHDNNATGTNSSGGVQIGANGAAFAILSNTTIFNNHGTSGSAGLSAIGTVTLANNAVAENTSTAASNFQFYSPAATGLTLRNNHFGTEKLTGTPSSELATTTGDPQWTGSGNLKIPNSQSPLRDSGLNSPTGGLAATDYRGKTRIINGTVDRGAVEADPVVSVGPTVTALSPAADSSTMLAGGKVSDATFLNVSFSAAGGANQGTTTLACSVSSGTVKILTNPTQTIAVGGTPALMRIYFVLATQAQTGTIHCVTTPFNALPGSIDYSFQAPAGTVLGPTVIADAPLEGSTTELAGTAVGDLLSQTLQFSASGGGAGASTAIDCFEAAGAVVITSNKAQVVATGDTPKPVGLAFEVQSAPQATEVRCTVTQQGVAGSTLMHFYFNVAGPAVLFGDGFE